MPEWGLFFLGASILSALVFLYPYIFYPRILQRFPKKPLRLPATQASLPSATLVFCAYNEATSLPDKIANLRAIRECAPYVQFKAYVDLSSDDTAAILNKHSDLIDVRVATERTGKCLGMRQLVAASDTEVVIFTDANVMVDPDSVSRMLAYFADPEVGGVCGGLIYVNPDESTAASTNSSYWRLEERIKGRESDSGSTMGADGSLFALRRSLYPTVPEHLLDDFISSMAVVFAGKRLISAPDVRAFERSAAVSADEFRRKRRIAARAYASHRHIWPQVRRTSGLNRFKYVSHRFLRWHGATFLELSAAAGLAAVASVSVVAAFALAMVGAALLAACLKARAGSFSKIGEIVRALVATQLGVYDALRGRRYQTWQPAQSR